MTVIYTETEAMENARCNLLWWSVAPAVVAAADKARLIELIKMRRAQFTADGLAYLIAEALIRDLER